MDKKRIFDIMQEQSMHNVLYDEKPVWIQEMHDNIATIGFLDGTKEKDVYIEDLYEKDLYE